MAFELLYGKRPFPEKRRQGLARLLEEFSREADRLGILMKTHETMDI